MRERRRRFHEIDVFPCNGESSKVSVTALQQQRLEELELYLRQHARKLFATARRFVQTDDEAHDVLQDALVSALRSIGDFEATASLSTWLHRIVINAALMRLRASASRREDSIDEFLPRFDEKGRRVHAGPAWKETVEAALERRQERDAVRSCIDRLPESYRTVLVLRDFEDLSVAEAAGLLGVTANTVKVRLHRARQALRELLVPIFGENSR